MLLLLLALLLIAAIAAAAYVLLLGPWASRPFVAAFVAFALLLVLNAFLVPWLTAGAVPAG